MQSRSRDRRQFPAAALLAAATCLLAPVQALGDEDHHEDTDHHDHDHGHLGDHMVEEIIVYGRAEQHIGSAATASEGLVGYADYHLPPLLRVGELVEAMPGMVATQHSGTGKANQYFLRGFNLDHGTDFSAHLDGVPVNMRSHGHGQGYLDLNFLIPELVETAVYRKGVYHAERGDFSSAGSIDFAYYHRLPERLAQATLGEHGYGRGVVAGSTDLAGGAFTGALDITVYDGPWLLNENLEQYKLYLSQTFDVAGAEVRVAFHGYDGRWDATDQVPARAIRSGLIDRRGFIDPDLGGETRRLGVTAQAAAQNWQLGSYFLDYDFTLFSNFTYLLDDPVLGDEFEQHDSRSIMGIWFEGDTSTWLGQRPLLFRWGGNLRFDDIDAVGLYGTHSRIRTDSLREDRVKELSLGAYGEAELELTDRLRAILGLRADYYDWDVSALRPEDSGSGDDAVANPKVNLAYRINPSLEVYAGWGRGFHSNDVRVTHEPIDSSGATGDRGLDVLSRSEGAEIGLRYEPDKTFNATLTGFWLELDSELVYVGDAGVTEPSGGSRRTGLELAAFWHPSHQLTVNAAYTLSNAKFTGGSGMDDEIPGAIERTFSVGLNALVGNGFHMSVNARYLGSAPLVEDNSIRSGSSWLLNAGVAYHYRRYEFRLDLFNLLDSDDDDIAYFYESRLTAEPPEGISDLHFHPLEPRTLRATVAMHW